MTDPAGLRPELTCLGVFAVGPGRTVASIVEAWLRERGVEHELAEDDVMFESLCGRDADGSWRSEARIHVRTAVLNAEGPSARTAEGPSYM